MAFTTHCAACHGNDGRSSLPGMPDFVAGDSLMRPDVEIYRRIHRQEDERLAELRTRAGLANSGMGPS